MRGEGDAARADRLVRGIVRKCLTYPVVSLKVSDVDCERMMLRVEQGNGRKDRHAMLSPVLLELLRDCYRVAHRNGARMMRIQVNDRRNQSRCPHANSPLNTATNAALADPSNKAHIADLGFTVNARSPAEFEKLIAEETEKWADVIRAANIKPSKPSKPGKSWPNIQQALLCAALMPLKADERAHRHAEPADFFRAAQVRQVDDEAGGQNIGADLLQ